MWLEFSEEYKRPDIISFSSNLNKWNVSKTWFSPGLENHHVNDMIMLIFMAALTSMSWNALKITSAQFCNYLLKIEQILLNLDRK